MPKIYNGENHTFFFVNYEGQRIRTSGALFADVPTPQEIQGDFSAPGLPVIYDPTTYDVAPGQRCGKQLCAVAGPEERLRSGQCPRRYSIIDTFRTRYAALPGAGNFDDIRGQNAALSWVHVFTPNLVNEGRIGFNRDRYLTPPENTGAKQALTLFGFANTTTNPVTSAGLPGFGFANGISGLGPGGQFPQDSITQTWQLVENVTWQKGAHSLKFGIDLRSTGPESDCREQ